MANVLVVDDELSIQRMLGYLLRKEEHDVTVAGSAFEALGYLETRSMDLILLDVAMPEMNGIALLQYLRKKPEYKTMPIVMLTASTNERHRIEAEVAGADAYLNKLANPDELVTVINNVLQRHQVE